MTTPTSPRTPSAIDAVAEEFMTAFGKLVPEHLVSIGSPDAPDHYADYSPAGTAQERELYVSTLEKLKTLEPTDDADAVTLDIMNERLTVKLELLDTGVPSFNNIASPAQGIRSILDLMPQETAEDWATITRRIKHIPAALEGYRATLEEARTNGKVPAVRQVDIVAEQCAAYAAEDGYFAKIAEIAAPAGLDDAARDELVAAATQAGEAYADFAEYVTNVLRPSARQEDACGREYYALASRDFLGAEVDLEEAYQWGVEELDRIIAEQEEVAEQIKPGASIEEAMDVLNADPKRQLHGTDALREWMQELSDKAVRELAGTHFEIDPPMDRLECMIAPTNEGGIYYTGPSDDFSRPGRMWWSVPEGEDTFTTWSETSTVYHEGVPGHHLQIATSTINSDELNSFRREFSWTSGHGEGWALYAERLMEELGYLEDPGDRLGMLMAQRLRAARVVFDIGLHCGFDIPGRWGSGVWTAEKGLEFLKKNVFESEGRIEFEWLRYMGWPGQAPSYKIGEQIWMQIRAEAEEREGSEFSAKDFHTRALKLGGMGLDSLRRALR